MIFYDGAQNVFETTSEVARGGEGAIYRIKGLNDYCIKVYHSKPTPQKIKKLQILRKNGASLKDFGAFPTSFAYADKNKSDVSGIFLPFISGHEIYELYGPSSRIQKFPNVKFNFLVHVAINIAYAFNKIHESGFIIGDINEQNIKVLNDGTIRFIDTDSFQYITTDIAFTCNVGTPIWTPPELHGKDLRSLVRNENHDYFGLAQIIFLILFCGRHPFAGRPRDSRHLLPEEAVREYAFAFAPSNHNIPLLPPPGCIKTDSFDSNIYYSFCRAFLKGAAEPNARPNSSEWITLLSALKDSLIGCLNRAEHIYWKGASSCPWCSVVNETGIDLFPRQSSVNAFLSHNSSRDLESIKRLNNLRPTEFPIPEQATFSDIIAEPLPQEPTGFFVDVQKFLEMSSWKKSWLTPHIERFTNRLKLAQDSYWVSVAAHKKAVGEYKKRFNELLAELKPIIQQATSPERLKKEIYDNAIQNRRAHELKIYLTTIQVRNSNIQDIGYGRKATLASYGIETAADVTNQRISGISGFGYSLTKRLLDWRKEVENSFRFNPNAPTPRSFHDEIDKMLSEKIDALKKQVSILEGKFRQSESFTADVVRSEASKAFQASRTIAQMNKNIAFYSSRLPK